MHNPVCGGGNEESLKFKLTFPYVSGWDTKVSILPLLLGNGNWYRYYALSLVKYWKLYLKLSLHSSLNSRMAIVGDWQASVGALAQSPKNHDVTGPEQTDTTKRKSKTKTKSKTKNKTPAPALTPTRTSEENRKESEPAPPPPIPLEPPTLEDDDEDNNPLNFEVNEKGTLPAGINQKSYYVLHLGPQETITLKINQVLKCTGGKVRVRNINQKGFNEENSLFVGKNDVLKVLGPVVIFNPEHEDNAHFRVFNTAEIK
ncbi:unnamed protein product [Allacma fusca]|uniref:Uncharacterized protein n=1 Tax=Allacma fusca TaxID=39272 RepID=A0A8J2PDD0_9HEXA|nr:unnamed protein product [Allacma fusca]